MFWKMSKFFQLLESEISMHVSVTLRLTHLRNYEPNHFLTPSVLSNYNMVVSNSL